MTLLPDERTQLIEFGTATICNTDKKLKVLPADFKSAIQRIPLCGTVRTLDLPEDDFLSVIALLDEAQEGEVLVINSQVQKRAVSGEMFINEAIRKKLGGLVVNGAFRDIKNVQQLSFPVFYRFLCPMAGTAHKLFPRQTTLTMGGIDVSPGDTILGDMDGLILIPRDYDISSLRNKAANIKQMEEEAIASMKLGTPFRQIVNFDTHIDSIKAGKRSKLGFR